MTPLEKKEASKSFGLSAGCFGIIFPSLGAMAFNGYNDIPSSGKLSLALVVVSICALYPFIVANYYDANKPKWKIILIDITLYICCITTILLMGFIVHNTGGMPHSLFAFYFFFVPSAIAVAYEASIGLVIAGLSSFAAVSYNIFNPVPRSDTNMFDDFNYTCLYAAFVFVHLTAIIVLEITANRGKSSNSGDVS